MKTVFVVIGSNDQGDVWTVSAHYNYDGAQIAWTDTVDASANAGGDLSGEMFKIEETLLS